MTRLGRGDKINICVYVKSASPDHLLQNKNDDSHTDHYVVSQDDSED